jgi:hypothetical protein
MDNLMKREYIASLTILILGVFSMWLYWQGGSASIDGRGIKERILLPDPDSNQELPEVASYRHDLKRLMDQGKAVLPLDERELDAYGKKVQALLLKNREFLRDTVTFDGKLEHNDMMSIRPAIVSVMRPATKRICQASLCYQAEKYNFISNTTTRAVVDVKRNQILEIQRFAGMQPDVSLRLTHIAQAIALNAPEMREALGGKKPKFKDMSMANVRGGLHDSPCDNANHLCVAPTFSYHDKEEALWAIVDLTDLKLVAAKWAGLGKTTTPSCISERTLQNRYIMENFCQKDSWHEEDGWRFAYRITGSDGLEVIDASFEGKPVIRSMKIVDWHVSYKAKEGASQLDTTQDTYVEGRRVEYIKGDNDEFFFGYNDAMGCPMFSTSVVLAFNAPRIKPLIKDGKKVGFYLIQDYRNPKWPMACNYRYENRFEFYRDGSFRVVGVNKGRGCGKNALYRPVMRIDMALGGHESFYKFDGNWTKWYSESSDFQKEAKVYDQGKYLYKIVNQKDNIGYYIEPNRGQFGDQSRGDNATIFATRYKEGEGEQDLLTLGSCCKLSEDGVERYLDAHEQIEGEDIVLWYVPRIRNDAREGHEYCWADTILEDGDLKIKIWPCAVGPKFVPTQKEK